MTPGPRPLLTAIRRGHDRLAVTTPDGTISYHHLRDLSTRLSRRLTHDRPVGLWATPELATVVGLCGALMAGTPVVPLNPKSGASELDHVLRDAAIDTILVAATAVLPDAAAALRRVTVEVTTELSGDDGPGEFGATSPLAPALIMYTSGTTGPPKGVVLSRAAIDANLEALATIWGWTESDLLVHALPLFHVHGLVLGLLGPLYVGGSVRLLGPFTVEAITQGLTSGGTMLFAVPTMYHRLASALDSHPDLGPALRQARLLVSGSGPLTTDDYRRIERATGQRIVERYGMTETLIITSGDPRDPARPGSVGHPLSGVAMRVVDESGDDVTPDDASVGTVLVRTPSLFSGYFGATPASDASTPWFRTGDLGTLAEDGSLRLVGRASTDLVKSGGFRVGTGEIELVLRNHPEVEDAAVRGVPDDDLGQRLVAWVVPKIGASPSAHELTDYVATELSPYKRPREIRFVSDIPRNAMGKVQKHLLAYDGALEPRDEA